MDGQSDEVAVQHELCVPSPENVNGRRDQRDNGYAKIGEPRPFVAYRRKSQAVEQRTDAEGRKDRKDKRAKNRFQVHRKKGRVTDSHLCYREVVQHTTDAVPAYGQEAQQDQLCTQDQAYGQKHVLQVVFYLGGHHEPFVFQVAGNQKQHDETVDDMIDNLQPYADLRLLPEACPQKGHKHGHQHENP